MRLTAENNDNKVSVGCVYDAEVEEVYVCSWSEWTRILLTTNVNLALENEKAEIGGQQSHSGYRKAEEE